MGAPAKAIVLALALVLAACGGGERGPARDGGDAGAPPARGGADAGAPSARSVVTAEHRVAPRIVDLTVSSRALGRTAKVRLLTPPGSAPRRGWPVLWLLHGCCDTYESWTRSTSVDDMPRLRRVLVVMPEAGDVGFYSDWHNGGKGGAPAWETFHLTEVRRLLERDYGAGRRRAVAGLSMGGLGAMAYAARHRGMFAAAASYSGVLHPLADARFLLGLFARYTPDPRAIWGEPESGRWAAHDPTELAEHLRGTRLFVSSGDGAPGPFEDDPGRERDGTEAAVHRQSRAFVARLRAFGIPVRTDFYGAGVHDWPYWERELERSLPLLLGD